MKFIAASTLILNEEFKTLQRAYSNNEFTKIIEDRFEIMMSELIEETENKLTLGVLVPRESEAG